MTSTKSIITALTVVLVTGLGAWATLTLAQAQAPEPQSLSEAAQSRLLRGRYLVHEVALCIDCHSPRDEKGEFIAGLHLTGSALGFGPLLPMPWVPAAPKIAGLPAGYSDKDMVHFLMTGERPDGRGMPLPPMPPYRLNQEDAGAVTAYLRALAAGAR